MNRIVRIAAPFALAFAAFGAQASQLSTGDFGTQPVQAGTAPAQVGPVMSASQGEIGSGDLYFAPLRVDAPAAAPATPRAGRLVSQFAVGA